MRLLGTGLVPGEYGQPGILKRHLSPGFVGYGSRFEDGYRPASHFRQRCFGFVNILRRQGWGNQYSIGRRMCLVMVAYKCRTGIRWR